MLISALSAHMIHINLNIIFYTHVQHSPTKTNYIKYYGNAHTHTHITVWNITPLRGPWCLVNILIICVFFVCLFVNLASN